MERPMSQDGAVGWRGRGGALLALAAALLAFAYLALEQRWFSDAAFVAFRQAEHLAHGFGYVWNRGGPPVEAAGQPGWVLLSAAAMAVRIDPVLFAWYFGGLCGLAVLVLLYVAGRTLLDLSPWWAVVPPALLAAHRAFVSGAVGADGTRAATLLLLAGTLLLGGAVRGPAPVGTRRLASAAVLASGALFFAATLFLDLAPLLHLATAAGFALARPARERILAAGTSLAVHAALFVALALARVALFGQALPGSAVGAVPIAGGARLLEQFVQHTHGWLWLPLLLGGLALLAPRLPDTATALLLQAAALCAILVARGANAAAFVALDPVLPALALLLTLALGALLRLRGEAPGARRTAILAIITLGLVGTQASTSIRPFQPAPPLRGPEELEDEAEAMLNEGQALARFLGPDDRIATVSRGAVPYITRAWHAPLRSYGEAVRDRILVAGVFGGFLYDRPFPPGRVPRAPVVDLPAGAPVFCLRLPEGSRPYWIFASARSEADVRAWAAEAGLEVVYVDAWRARSRDAAGTIGAP